MAHSDREARLAYGRAYYERHKALVLKARHGHYADNGERIRAERALKRTTETRATNSAKQKERYRLLRAEVINEYGGTCSCCGEGEPIFLELDHTGDDGAHHRREIGRGSYRTYRVVKLAGFPKDRFRLMCANCNQGRQRNGGVCPHVG